MTDKNKTLIKIIIAGTLFILSGKMIYDRVMIYLYKDTVEISETKTDVSQNKASEEFKTEEVKIETKTLENQTQTNQITEQKEPAKLHRITIKYQNRKAKKVKLNGSFFGWKERDMKKENGEWVSELSIKDPGEYKYYFLVDGKKVLDSKAKKSKDGSFSVIEVKWF